MRRLISLFGLALIGMGVQSLLRAGQAPNSKGDMELLGQYSKSGPVGDIFRALKADQRTKKVGVAGLGNGVLAAYSQAGQDWTFYELDEDAIETAENPKRCSYLRDAKGKIRIMKGEPRYMLQTRVKSTFGLLIIDAFNSDAVPIHLVTREAVVLYQKRLQVDGILVFHISNRYLDLEPVLANVAADLKCVAYCRRHEPSATEEKTGVIASQWLVVAKQKSDLAALLKNESWKIARKTKKIVWTDDYAPILDSLKLPNEK